MNDTVRKLMELADDYAMSSIQYGIFSNERGDAKDALKAELTRLFTPLSDENGSMSATELHIDLIEGAVNKLRDENKKLRQDIDSLAEINYQLARKMKEERQRKRPLSEEWINTAMLNLYGIELKDGDYADDILLVRAVEKAHGIGGES